MASPAAQPPAPDAVNPAADTSDHDTQVTQARLTSPMGVGEPLDFDPDMHEAPLSDEEFDELTRDTAAEPPKT